MVAAHKRVAPRQRAQLLACLLLALILASDAVALEQAVSSHASRGAGRRALQQQQGMPDAEAAAPTLAAAAAAPPPGNDTGINWQSCDKVASISSCGKSLLVTPDDMTCVERERENRAIVLARAQRERPHLGPE